MYCISVPLLLCCSTLSAYHDVVRECEEGLAGFTGMKDKVILCTSHDVSQELVKFNCTTKKMMVVRNRGGNKLLSPEEFVNVSRLMALSF